MAMAFIAGAVIGGLIAGALVYSHFIGIIRGNLRTLEELKLDGARLRGAVETTAKILGVTLDATLDTPEGDEAHAEN